MRMEEQEEGRQGRILSEEEEKESHRLLPLHPPQQRCILSPPTTSCRRRAGRSSASSTSRGRCSIGPNSSSSIQELSTGGLAALCGIQHGANRGEDPRQITVLDQFQLDAEQSDRHRIADFSCMLRPSSRVVDRLSRGSFQVRFARSLPFPPLGSPTGKAGAPLSTTNSTALPSMRGGFGGEGDSLLHPPQAGRLEDRMPRSRWARNFDRS
jgi:hypothetical protein